MMPFGLGFGAFIAQMNIFPCEFSGFPESLHLKFHVGMVGERFLT